VLWSEISMAGRRKQPTDNSAAIAAQFGISLKALRLYERLGMLNAPRNAAGWRVYGPAEIERLHGILSFKQLGLPLARIAELLKARSTDLTALLSVQEDMLLESRRESDHALALIRIAKVRVRERGKLSADELAALVRSISKTLIRSTAELEDLAQRVYTPEQVARFNSREQNPEDAARISASWAKIYADIDAMLPGGDPLSKKGLAIVRCAVALIQEQTRGDKELWNNAARFWQQAIADPHTSDQIPMNQACWDFMAEGMAELKRRGELKP
jgi:MerR family transcriptional regulator, thiopeptide resistance regulator